MLGPVESNSQESSCSDISILTDVHRLDHRTCVVTSPHCYVQYTQLWTLSYVAQCYIDQCGEGHAAASTCCSYAACDCHHLCAYACRRVLRSAIQPGGHGMQPHNITVDACSMVLCMRRTTFHVAAPWVVHAHGAGTSNGQASRPTTCQHVMQTGHSQQAQAVCMSHGISRST